MKGKKPQAKQGEKSPEKDKSPQKKDQSKSPSNSKTKNGDKNKVNKAPLPKFEKKQGSPEPKFKLDFIYRREKYTLEHLKENVLVSFMKRKIAQKLNVEQKALKFYYKENELKEEKDKDNLKQMIKDDPYPIIEVKKEILNEQNIISLNTKVNLVYKVECKKITDYIDFINKIEQFFKDICIVVIIVSNLNDI